VWTLHFAGEQICGPSLALQSATVRYCKKSGLPEGSVFIGVLGLVMVVISVLLFSELIPEWFGYLDTTDSSEGNELPDDLTLTTGPKIKTLTKEEEILHKDIRRAGESIPLLVKLGQILVDKSTSNPV
jgi:hypothetical protein